MPDDLLPYIHPLSGGGVLSALAYVGWLGLRLRTERRDRARLAARHARLAPWVYGLVLASWVGGVSSTVWLRHDLEAFSSLHFRVGTLMCVLLSGSALTARAMTRGHAVWRSWHPWLGAGALLLAAAHAVTGLRLTP